MNLQVLSVIDTSVVMSAGGVLVGCIGTMGVVIKTMYLNERNRFLEELKQSEARVEMERTKVREVLDLNTQMQHALKEANDTIVKLQDQRSRAEDNRESTKT